MTSSKPGRAHTLPSLSIGIAESASAPSSTSSTPDEQRMHRTFSDDLASFPSMASHRRTCSEGSAKKPYSPPKNVYTHCGRHTDQFLFGGNSMSELFKSAFGRKGQ